MRMKKEFDCVEMKNVVQAKHRKDYQGLSDEEVRRRIHERLAKSDHPAARLWRKLVEAEEEVARK